MVEEVEEWEVEKWVVDEVEEWEVEKWEVEELEVWVGNVRLRRPTHILICFSLHNRPSGH